AQGDQPTLIQACQDLISRRPTLIATCPTLSTIVAAQRTKDIPILMMVSPRPDIVGLASAGGAFQSNLLGAYETLDYLKEGPAIIRQVVPQARTVGLVYNPAEPQSVAAQVLVSKGVQAFFAMPDNTVFASFEALKKVCDQARLPVFTSESGLVARGA